MKNLKYPILSHLMLLVELCISAASLAKSVMQREMCVTSYTASSLTFRAQRFCSASLRATSVALPSPSCSSLDDISICLCTMRSESGHYSL